MREKNYIEALLKEADAYKDGNPSDEFITLLNQISEFEEREKDDILLSIVKSLKQIDSPLGVGLLAIWFGGFVENGKNPEPYIPYLMDSFLHFGNMALEDKTTQNVVGLEMGLTYLGQSLVAHLARSSTVRSELSQNEELLDKIDDISEFSNGAMWIYEVFQKVSDTLVVIHAEEKVGVRVRYENISTCFHLFTLLQESIAEVMPGSKESPEEILQIAKTGEYVNEDDRDEAWWHYGQGFSKEANVLNSVFGELSPSSISRVNGEQLMLLWSPILDGRFWGCDFCRPYLEAMPPSVELVEVLTQDEVDNIWNAIDKAEKF